MKIFIKIIIFLCLTFLNIQNISAGEKIKIGLLVPITGQNSEIGKSIIKSVRLAINKINNPSIEIFPKDTASSPEITLRNAKELYETGVKIIIGPVFNKNLIYLDELKEIIFLSLTNKIIDNPKNIISAGINAGSQLNTISKFQKLNEIKKTIFLIPKENYKEEIEKAIIQSKIKTSEVYYYDSDPTKLTKQIEKITKYHERKKDLERRIKILEKSDLYKDKNELKKLEQKHTLGKIDFDSVIVVDFDEYLKSVLASFMFSDISSKDVNFFTLNQWFDETLFSENASQNLHFPAIDLNNYKKFKKKYSDTFEQEPNEVAILAYDAVGLIYYCWNNNNSQFRIDQLYNKNGFKGLHAEFIIKDNLSRQKLKIYKVSKKKFIKVY